MFVTVHVSLWSQSFGNLSQITQFRKNVGKYKKSILIEAKVNNFFLFLEENDFALEISSDIVQFLISRFVLVNLRGMISSIDRPKGEVRLLN